MFIRKKTNKSGVISIQIINKSSGKYEVLKTVGSSSDPKQVEYLLKKARRELDELLNQSSINLDQAKEDELFDLFFNGLKSIWMVGPEMLLGKIFDEIGFNKIEDELFRHLVLSRLCFPLSKLKTLDYLFRYQGIRLDIDKVYRYLDKLNTKQKALIQQISYQHTLEVLQEEISVVFYDVTTLCFESEQADDLRKTGYSKNGKHNNPQILLGLLLSIEGYPLAYDIFEGNKFEGHTLLPIIQAFKAKYNLQQLIVVADAGMLSAKNVQALEDQHYEYILGARLKAEEDWLAEQVLSLNLKNGECQEAATINGKRLIVSYSSKRAKKDEFNRQRGLDRLEKAVASGKLTKKNINSRGYNKYLKLEGEVDVKIDYRKFELDAEWDGLKGYWTNTTLPMNDVIAQYGNLWKIERAFRISKTDLRIRPILVKRSDRSPYLHR